MTAALAILALGSQVGVGIIFGLLLYFMGFNLLEATIPSWISKRAPVANKATAMGLNSSSQFFGAFVGGAMGGLLLSQPNVLAWGILATHHGCCIASYYSNCSATLLIEHDGDDSQKHQYSRLVASNAGSRRG